MNIKKIAGIVLPVVAVVSVSALLLASASAPLQVEAVTLQSGNAEVIYTEQGSCVYQNSLRVTAPLDGEIEEIRVKEGQKVKEGDVLAVISATDADYEIRRLEQEIEGYNAQIWNLTLAGQRENSELAGQRGDLEEQKSLLESEDRASRESEKTRESQIILQEDVVLSDRKNVEIARRALREYRDGYEDFYGDTEYNTLRQAVNDAEKQLAASEQKLVELRQETVQEGYYDERRESIDTQLERINGEMGKNYNSGMQSYYQTLIAAARLNIEQLREKQGKATVTAACDGTISELVIKELGMVEQGTVIATIGMEPVVEVFVPVREMDGIQVGDAVTLTIGKRQGDLTEDGRVLEIASQAAVMLSPLGVEESRVRVLVAAQGGALAAGYQADVNFTVYQRENCIILPRKAVFELDGQDYVWLIADGVVTQHAVTIGAEVTGGYIAEEGLADSDVIIADANTQGLAEGKKVVV